MTNFQEIYKNLKELNDRAAYNNKDWRENQSQLYQYESEIYHKFLPMFLCDPNESIRKAKEIQLKEIPLDKCEIPIYTESGKIEAYVLIVGQYSIYHRIGQYVVGHVQSGYGLPYAQTNFDECDAAREAYANHLYIDLDFLGIADNPKVNLPSQIKSLLWNWNFLLRDAKWNRRGKLKYSLKEQ